MCKGEVVSLAATIPGTFLFYKHKPTLMIGISCWLCPRKFKNGLVQGRGEHTWNPYFC